MENKNLVQICNVCNIEQNISEYSKLTKSYRKTCKSCRHLQHIARDRTKEGLVRRIFTDQKANSTKRGHSAPKYTLEELVQWVFDQENFESLYLTWVNSQFDSYSRPSIDRIKDELPYALTNITLTTWFKNNTRSHTDKLAALGTHTDLIPIYQYTETGVFICTHSSINIGARAAGLKSGASIIASLKKNTKAGGYRWSRKKFDVLKIDKTVIKLDSNRQIEQHSLDGVLIRVWPSIKEIRNDLFGGKRVKGIEETLKGTQAKSNGFLWKYASINTIKQTLEKL